MIRSVLLLSGTVRHPIVGATVIATPILVHSTRSIKVFMSDLNPALSVPTVDYLPAEIYVVRPPPQRYWLHLLLFLGTIFTTLVVGAKMEFDFLNNIPPFVHGDEVIPLFPAQVGHFTIRPG